MADFATGQGYYLAELIKHYHHYRDEYLDWALPLFNTRTEAILTYQKALAGWYEARIRRHEPYVGEIMVFLKAATSAYNGTLDTFNEEWSDQGLASLGPNPVRYLPRSVRLSVEQEKMIDLYLKMNQADRDLLILAYYHQLSDHRLHAVLDIGTRASEATRARRAALLRLREQWRLNGIVENAYQATPEQEEIIDRYLRDELDVTQRWEVEAERSSDEVFRLALQLREDFEEGLRLAGRRDTLETLVREEDRYAAPKVNLSAPRPSIVSGGSVQAFLAAALFGVLLYLLYLTFAPATEQQLFAEYFRPFPNVTLLPDSTGWVSPEEEELGDILEAYDQQNYLVAYDELLPAASAYPSARMYLGVSALALEQPQRALEWFDQYLPAEKYYPYARWYMALAYLADGRDRAALRELVEIAGTPGHPYEIPATKLIEALE